MLPPLKHRLVIGLALIVGSLCWLVAIGPLRAADGSGGLSLTDARVGTLAGFVVVVLASLPAVAGGLVCSSTGNPLTGVFVVGGSLVPLASLGGSMQGYLWRAQLPGGYGSLAVEAGLWLVFWIAAIVAIDRLRRPVRQKLPRLAVRRHLGTRTSFGMPGGKPLLAGLIAAAAGGFVSNLLIQSVDGGQVNGGLLLGFAVGAMVAQMSVPQRNPVAILLSPLVVAAGAYVWVWRSYGSQDAVLAAWYGDQMLNLALGLPIQYASSGVAGCAIGVGLAQAMDHVRQTTAVTA